ALGQISIGRVGQFSISANMFYVSFAEDGSVRLRAAHCPCYSFTKRLVQVPALKGAICFGEQR
ncbi:hypothetical protein, partial [Stutzerimonas nitrititolerans]|uniref:hypothetical protein n=1 Tax=Stutzerimonas nitrititolerans TaxID=2482751 RepID=UPI0028A9113E